MLLFQNRKKRKYFDPKRKTNISIAENIGIGSGESTWIWRKQSGESAATAEFKQLFWRGR